MDDSKDSNEREDERHTLVYGGWLFQQLHVGAYTCIEGNLFMWVRLNQHILKTELYNGLNGVIRILTLNKKNLWRGMRLAYY